MQLVFEPDYRLLILYPEIGTHVISRNDLTGSRRRLFNIVLFLYYINCVHEFFNFALEQKFLHMQMLNITSLFDVNTMLVIIVVGFTKSIDYCVGDVCLSLWFVLSFPNGRN